MSNLLQKRGNAIYFLFREYMKKNVFIKYNIIIIILGFTKAV